MFVEQPAYDRASGAFRQYGNWAQPSAEDLWRERKREERMTQRLEGLEQAGRRTNAARKVGSVLAPGNPEQVAALLEGLYTAGGRSDAALRAGGGIRPGTGLRGSSEADQRAQDLAAGLGQSGENTDAALRSIRPVTYKYKPAALSMGSPSGPRYGVMAQDLEKTPLGRTMVVDTPQGKVIDHRTAATANTAMIGRLGQRLDELEGRGGAMARYAREAE
jgi:hypothetical protein